MQEEITLRYLLAIHDRHIGMFRLFPGRARAPHRAFKFASTNFTVTIKWSTPQGSLEHNAAVSLCPICRLVC